MSQSPIEILSKVADDAGVLRAVRCTRHPELPERIATVTLEFEALTLNCRVDADDDTLALSLEAVSTPSAAETLSGSGAWANAVGAALRWGWVMTNNQGYADGVQFEFANPSDRSSVCLQLIAIASGVEVRSVVPLSSS